MNEPSLEELLSSHLRLESPSTSFEERLRLATGAAYRRTFRTGWRRVPWWLWALMGAALLAIVLLVWQPWAGPGLFA